MSTAEPRIVAPPAHESPAQIAAPHERIVSIDVLRGFTILVMIFVNDLAGVVGTPGWMKHIEPSNADGMTFVDVVFPAFLFIVGMSIPFALERRLAREPAHRAVAHVLVRTLGLLAIGVFMVNTETIGADGPLHPQLWTLLMYLAVVLVWLAPAASLGLTPRAQRLARLGGAAMLVALAFLYRGTGEPGLLEMRTSWWGILGLIGWAYLVSCVIYVAFRRRVEALAGGVVLLYALFIADRSGYFAGWGWLTGWVDVGSMLGSHAALTLSGAVLGTVLLPGSPVATHAERLRWGLAFGAFMAVAAHLLHAGRDVHAMFIVNKIAATPAWCLWSAAFTVWIWAGVYWLLDVRRARRGSAMLEAAGQNALLAYILAPIFYAAFALAAVGLAMPDPYAALGASFAPGLARAIVFAFAVTALAAVMRRRGFVLRL